MNWFAFSQGSSFLATLGCGDAIPLGLTGGARRMLDQKQEPRITPIRPMNTKTERLSGFIRVNRGQNRIPTGFRPGAQGCDAGATLGRAVKVAEPQRGCVSAN